MIRKYDMAAMAREILARDYHMDVTQYRHTSVSTNEDRTTFYIAFQSKASGFIVNFTGEIHNGAIGYFKVTL